MMTEKIKNNGHYTKEELIELRRFVKEDLLGDCQATNGKSADDIRMERHGEFVKKLADLKVMSDMTQEDSDALVILLEAEERYSAEFGHLKDPREVEGKFLVDKFRVLSE